MVLSKKFVLWDSTRAITLRNWLTIYLQILYFRLISTFRSLSYLMYTVIQYFAMHYVHCRKIEVKKKGFSTHNQTNFLLLDCNVIIMFYYYPFNKFWNTVLYVPKVTWVYMFLNLWTSCWFHKCLDWQNFSLWSK